MFCFHVGKNPFIKVDAEIDQKTMLTAKSAFANHAHFSCDNNTTTKGITSFIIRHYAGEVTYMVGMLSVTNKDSLKSDLINLMKSSKLPMISESLYQNFSADDKQVSRCHRYDLQ